MKQGIIALGIMISMTLFVSGCVDHAELVNRSGIMSDHATVELVNTASRDVRIPGVFDIAVGYLGYTVETISNSTIYPSLPMAKIDYTEITMSPGEKLTEVIDIFEFDFFKFGIHGG